MERSLGDLVLRETREEESAIEEGNIRRKRQAKTACTSPFKKCPLMFRMLFVTLASETKAPLVSPIYINDI
jgi:hypothetical protein